MAQLASVLSHLDKVRHRSEPLLLGFKDSDASGLQAPPGHADAAIADPILRCHLYCVKLS